MNDHFLPKDPIEKSRATRTDDASAQSAAEGEPRKEGSSSAKSGRIMPRLRFGIRDALLILVLFLIGLIPFFIMNYNRNLRSGSGTQAVLTVQGEEVWRHSIYDDVEPVEHTVYINGESITVRVDPTGAWVSRSDCPKQVCVHTGKISKVGETVVCIPFRAVLRIESSDANNTVVTDELGEIDAVSE
ncbi:MAG: NusG domain II-containing protein [Clostridiales bacterium]|nr:NusG domain II-containing protein [Clostridiales bacterium]